MFYCDDCRIKRNWPNSFIQSRGQCECCGESAVCWDRPSSSLPKGPVPVDNVAFDDDESEGAGFMHVWRGSQCNTYELTGDMLTHFRNYFKEDGCPINPLIDRMQECPEELIGPNPNVDIPSAVEWLWANYSDLFT